MSDLEPGIHDPDWERYAVTKDGTSAPVGNPTLWGNEVFTPLTPVLPSAVTPQFLQLATHDAYARSWSVLGTLTLPIGLWQLTELDVTGGTGAYVQLLITMGVGLIRLTHAVALLFPGHFGPNGPSSPPSPAGGLCLSQNWFYGGPYNDVSEGVGSRTRSFAIVGGLVGQTISMRAEYSISGTTVGLPFTSRLSVIATPYAAGEGL